MIKPSFQTGGEMFISYRSKILFSLYNILMYAISKHISYFEDSYYIKMGNQLLYKTWQLLLSFLPERKTNTIHNFTHTI